MFTYLEPATADPAMSPANKRIDLPPEYCASNANCIVGTVTEHYRAVERVILAMYENLGNPMSLEDMAEIAMFSPYHFNRVFHHIVGIPPFRFLATLRLQAAKQLLLTSQLSVTDVCFELGYNGLGTFVRRFTELVGVSPGRLRCLASETTPYSLEALCHHSASLCQATPCRGGLTGQITVPATFAGPLLIGIFPTPIPQGRPVGCDLLTTPGIYHIASVPDGHYYVFATGLTGTEDLLAGWFLDNTKLYVGRSQDALFVSGTQVYGNADVTLRPMYLTDPPMLTALPFLLTEHLTADHVMS